MRDFTLVGPEGDFSVDQNIICRGEVINFVLLDTVDVQTWVWEFGDGDRVLDESNISHQYDSSGNFLAQLILTGVNGICETVVQEPIIVQQVEAAFTVVDICEGPIDIVSNSIGPIENFTYNFGDGGSSNQENPTYTFANVGLQTVQLIVSSGIGCADSVTQNFEIFPVPVPVVADVGGCEDFDITLAVANPTAGNTYSWNPVELVDTDGEPSVTVNLNQTTEFTVVE